MLFIILLAFLLFKVNLILKIFFLIIKFIHLFKILILNCFLTFRKILKPKILQKL